MPVRTLMLRVIQFAVLASLAVLLPTSASGQCIPSLCAVALTVQSDGGGVVLGGSGTNSATLAFGTMQAFGGTTLSGVTKTVTATNWTISTPFDVKVTCTVIATLLPCTAAISPSYTLTAQLQSADGINTWKVGGMTLSSGGGSTLTTTGTFSQVVSYQFALTIPFSASAGVIANHVNLVATSN